MKGQAPDGYLILKLAERYGQSPADVENWDEYWFERAAVEMEGESIHYSKKK